MLSFHRSSALPQWVGILFATSIFARFLPAQTANPGKQGTAGCSIALVAAQDRGPDGRNSMWGYFDLTGRTAIPPTFSRVEGFSEGLAAAVGGKFSVKGYGTEDLWGYIDATGAWAIQPAFFKTAPFHEGLASVQDTITGKFGVIDDKGEFIIPAQYDWIGPFSDGMALFGVGRENQIFGIIDRKGEIILDPQLGLYKNDWKNNNPVFSAGLLPALLNDKWGYVNKKGEFVIPAKYDDAAPFSEGFAFVAMNGRVGIINTKGKMIGAPIYDYYVKPTSNAVNIFADTDNMKKYRFSGGVSPVCLNGLWGVVNTRGAYIVKPNCADIHPYYEGLAMFKDNTGKRGYFDAAGKVAFTVESSVNLNDFSHGVAVFTKYTFDAKTQKQTYDWGVINRRGEQLVFSKPTLFPTGKYTCAAR